jgi:hypothetical protein
MWVKVDDRFPEHDKVFAAGAHLGPSSTGRVLAVWLEAMCWTNYKGTSGLLRTEAVRAFRHDRQPLKVAAAMAQPVRRSDGTMGPGLLVEVEDGFMVHDYRDHNDRQKYEAISAARSAAGKAGGMRSVEAKRQAKLKQIGKQLLEANGVNGKQNSSKPSTPFPGTRDLQVQEHRDEDVAGCAEPVEIKPKLLAALVRDEWKAYEKSGRQFEDETDLSEHMKGVAAKAGIPYDGPSIATAIRGVGGSNGKRLS